MRNFLVLLASTLLLTGCANGPDGFNLDADNPETDSKQILNITVTDSGVECEDVDSPVFVNLAVRNDSSDLIYVNSFERKTNLEVKLLNENGMGVATNDSLFSDSPGIGASEEGEIYAAFSALFIGFEGTFNRIQVLLDGKVISEKEINLSPESC
jgi:hypothetical protein